MGLVLVTPPAEEPVTLAEAVAHLRVDISDDDVLINALIVAARETFESDTRRALVAQTWDLVLDAFPSGSEIKLPLPPLASVTSITYKDAAEAPQTFATADYFVEVRDLFGRIVLKSGSSWPSAELWPAGAVSVRFVAGYASADLVPKSIKQAILLLVGHWYENRETVIAAGVLAREVPMAYDRLLWLHRVEL